MLTRLGQERKLLADAGRAIARGLRRKAEARLGGSLMPWARRFLPHYMKDADSDFHRWVAAELSGALDARAVRMNVKAPRGNAKSTWCSTFMPLFAICEETDPFIILVSNTSDLSGEFLQAIKTELEDNAALAEAYPDACGKGPIWSSRHIVTRNGVRVKAIGSGGALRGKRSRQSRPSLIVVDDADKDDAAYSEVKRERCFNWFTRAVMPAGDGSTNIIVVGTMIHEECLVGKLSTMPGWRGRTWRSIVEWPNRMDLWDRWESILTSTMDAEEGERLALEFYRLHEAEMNEAAVVLWPEHETLYDLMMMRAIGGHSAFESEKQNNPVPPSAVRFNPDWFAGEDLWWTDLPPGNKVALLAADPAVGRKTGTKDAARGDYAAIVFGWFVEGNPCIYVDADIKRRPAPETNAAVIELHRIYGFELAGYESNGFQGEFAEDLSQKAFAMGNPLPVRLIENTQNKILRIDRLATYFQHRQIRFRAQSEGAALLFRQCRLFSSPKMEAYDGPDALEMLVRLFRSQLGGAGEIQVVGQV